MTGVKKSKLTRSLPLVFVLAIFLLVPLNARAATYQFSYKLIRESNGEWRVVQQPTTTPGSPNYPYTWRQEGNRLILTIGPGTSSPVQTVPSPLPQPQPTPVPQPTPQPQPSPSPQPVPGLPAAAISADEQLMVDLVNRERAAAGLASLKVDLRLVKTARLKSQDMIDLGYFSHQSPTYGSPFDMMRAAGVNYRYAGENLAGAPTVTGAHQSLMASAGHRANILNPKFTHIGIGIINGGPYGKMLTQHFVGF